jgi:hypothetical protein
MPESKMAPAPNNRNLVGFIQLGFSELHSLPMHLAEALKREI